MIKFLKSVYKRLFSVDCSNKSQIRSQEKEVIFELNTIFEYRDFANEPKAIKVCIDCKQQFINIDGMYHPVNGIILDEFCNCHKSSKWK